MLDINKILNRAAEIYGSPLTRQAVAATTAIVEAINGAGEQSRSCPEGRMKRPTLGQVKEHGAKISLPEAECDRFYDHFESNGWKVGTAKTPMKIWTSALANWKRTWQERVAGGQKQNGACTVVYGKEYERVIDRMKAIKGNYSGHQAWREEDRLEFGELKTRREELKELLGIKI